MAKYNGHKNWNHWNVSLWLNNDEGLYRLAKAVVASSRTKEEAAQRLYDELVEVSGITHTPDGAPYTKTSIRAALRGL